LVVAVTGPRSAIGRRLRERLDQIPEVSRILCVDLEPDSVDRPKSSFARVDLTQPAASGQLSEVLKSEGVQALVHLAFLSRTIRDPSYAHELEAIGTLQVFAACEAASVSQIVMVSSTTVYGASPSNPNQLSEERALLGNPRSRWVCDKVEAEGQARRFAATHPDAKVAVLRLAPLIGPGVDNPITRLLSQRFVPTLWGYDPLVQTLHPADATLALETALLGRASGVFNIAGEGVLPLSSVIRLCGSTPLPLPHTLARTLVRALAALGIANVPPSLVDYLRYSWVADGKRAKDVLGFRPRYSTRSVVMDFAQRSEGTAARDAIGHGESPRRATN
jgi:UDP-glucose 4-epimerase